MSRILIGDCLDIMPTLPAASVDSIVTDPPYHLTTGKKGGSGVASLNEDSPAGRSRISTGFMGMAWDGGDVAFRPETWAAVMRVAKPGAHLLAFGGTRTFHRLMVAIEDAGWELRDTIMWVYGSGFPKSHNLEGQWEGWGTALKPAWEPIIVARKPLIGTVAENMAKHGTGALNIDACRIGTDDTRRIKAGGANQLPHEDDAWNPKTVEVWSENGRWPANLIHDGSDEVFAVFPDAPGQLADASSSNSSRKTQFVYGDMKPGNGREGEPSADSENDGIGFKMKPGARRLDEGSAARFFYCAKTDRQDRDEGLDGRGKKPLNWSSGEQNPGSFQSPNTDRSARNHHPTVKPTALMRYLCKLVTAPGGTILDPFAGSGSTGKAAILDGFSFIGIEQETEYAEIAEYRIAHVDPSAMSLT